MQRASLGLFKSDHLLYSILNNIGCSLPSLVLLEYGVSQSYQPLISHLLQNRKRNDGLILLCLETPKEELIHSKEADEWPTTAYFDLTSRIPGFMNTFDRAEIQRLLLNEIERAPAGPVDVFIDAIDSIYTDVGSAAEVYAFLKLVMDTLASRATSSDVVLPSRLMLPLQAHSRILPMLNTPNFHPNLASLRIHPPFLISHLANSFLTSPIPNDCRPSDTFWNLLHSIGERTEGDEMMHSGAGEREWKEGIVEVEVRRKGSRKGIERTLEGWRVVYDNEDIQSRRIEVCEWNQLESLRTLGGRWTNLANTEGTNLGTQMQGVPFEVMLTASQEAARARVPLPFLIEGIKTVDDGRGNGVILYEADSADDIDDDDPDEDLDL